MKSLFTTVAVTALIAFSLGYITRGAFERDSSPSKEREELSVREHPESAESRAQLDESSNQNDVGASGVTGSNQEVIIASQRSKSREHYKRTQLGDFFLINDIGPEREQQIIQGLIDADVYLELKRKEMIDRHLAAGTEPLTQERIDTIRLTAEENSQLYAEEESLYRQVIDEYYEAFLEYDRTRLQRETVRSLSSSLQEPLEPVAREQLVQIMYAERTRLESELASVSAGSDAHLANSSQGWEAEKEKYHERLLGMRSYNARVLDRARTYLTPAQFDQLKRRLENEARRFELLIELTDIDEAH